MLPHFWSALLENNILGWKACQGQTLQLIAKIRKLRQKTFYNSGKIFPITIQVGIWTKNTLAFWTNEWNSTLCFVLIKAYRGQLWKGKQNKILMKKIEGNAMLIIIKLQIHFFIAKMKSFRSSSHILLWNCCTKSVYLLYNTRLQNKCCLILGCKMNDAIFLANLYRTIWINNLFLLIGKCTKSLIVPKALLHQVVEVAQNTIAFCTNNMCWNNHISHIFLIYSNKIFVKQASLLN
jgi:hypothetical protein